MIHKYMHILDVHVFSFSIVVLLGECTHHLLLSLVFAMLHMQGCGQRCCTSLSTPSGMKFYCSFSPFVSCSFLHLCNLSGLNSNPCVLFGRCNFPDVGVCCPNEIVIVHHRSDLTKDEETLVEKLLLGSSCLFSSQIVPFFQELIIITYAVAVLMEKPTSAHSV